MNLHTFQFVLQNSIRLEDEVWNYQVPNLPHASILNSQQLIKSIAVISKNDKQEIVLRLQPCSPNRATAFQPLNRFISISFDGFRLRVPQVGDSTGKQTPDTQPATARQSSDYIVNMLRAGIVINSVHYHFYGHSNSQLKSRSCILFADTKKNISNMVEGLGDFKKMKTAAKKAKRIGLLFSTAKVVMQLNPDRCQDIPDIETGDYIFTDGCGLISPKFAHELSRRLNIAFRNARYAPSVFQIRYRGYKGVLTLDPRMKGEVLASFRKSMKKFSGGDDYSFSVVEYSKPYAFGYLNDEVVLLLQALGISETVLIEKQKEHLQALARAPYDPLLGFRFLTYLNSPELAEKVLMDSIEAVRSSISKLVKSEYDRMLNKRKEQRCRILIPRSRLLFGVCDAWCVLKEGECAVKVTMQGDGIARALSGMEILVTRNPCLHPGDLQKFRVVEKPELSHLIDCIVFSTCGRRPAADLMSGGDLDVFVCWDSDLIPETLSEAAHYPGAREPVQFKQITDDDRLVYFAKYNNASLGRVKNLYLEWARAKGPMCPECQELNRLFSTCVDGNSIRVPQKLESPPIVADAPFILDTLHDEAETFIQSQQNQHPNFDGYSFDAMELLLSRDDIAMSEFELLQLTYRWCRRNNANMMDFLKLFDVNLLTAEEKAWTLNHLPSTYEASLIMNALCQSNLLRISELQPFKLDYPGLRWKCVYDSSRDRLATFLDVATRTLELFHRKLIVVRVDERLTLAIYVPQKIEGRQECEVDDRVRLFAFPHSQGEETSHRLSLPTKKNYRLYCDSNVFQLFEKQRGNSWIFLKRAASNDSSYSKLETIGGRRRQRQTTIDNGVNFDCVASIALDKFSKGLQTHIGRVNRSGVLGAEIYVISNRDMKSMQTLDLWLQYIDTNKVMPLFDPNPKEYNILRMTDINWSEEPEIITRLAKENDFSVLDETMTQQVYHETFSWLLDRGQNGLLLKTFQYLIGQLESTDTASVKDQLSLQAMVDFLCVAPFLAVTFVNLPSWQTLPKDRRELLENSATSILKAYVLCANEAQDFIVDPFRAVLSQIQIMSLNDFSDLMELISLTVRLPDMALALIFDCLEPEVTRILVSDPRLVRIFTKNLFGLALDHIDEAAETPKPRDDLLELQLVDRTDGHTVVECHFRIDAPGGTLANSDHVRLKVASRPNNSPLAKLYSTDALVEVSHGGVTKFRCFHPLPSFVEECSWTLQYCGSFVTSKTMFDAVRKIATLPEVCSISDQILGTETGHPEIERLEGQYTAIDKLNASQNKAVETGLSSPLTFLWGPPGTGKTHTIVELIKQLQESPGNKRILVTAPTHNAVDNVMRKYLADVLKNNSDSLLSGILRVSTDVRKVAEDLKKYTCDAMAGKEIYTSHVALNKARDQIKKCRLAFTTCIGAGLGLLRSEDFDTVIIDEASQQTEPASLVPLVKGCTKAILVGDHVQLGATVQRHAVLHDFDISLFERLYRQDTSHQSGIAKVMLDTQYRMHESICSFISSEFYEGKLGTDVPSSTRPLLPSMFPWPALSSTSKPDRRMVFIECDAKEDFGGKSKSNLAQVNYCHEICKMLCTPPAGLNQSDQPSATNTLVKQTIAVLTPYSRQAELLKTRLSQFSNVEVSSIDGFQGREADIVVFVTVRCNVHYEIGFLKDLRRMNVVLTRARTGVIVIGDRATLTMGDSDPESTAVWKRLMSVLVEVRIDLNS